MYSNVFAYMFTAYLCTHSYICLLYANVPYMSSVYHYIPIYSLTPDIIFVGVFAT